MGGCAGPRLPYARSMYRHGRRRGAKAPRGSRVFVLCLRRSPARADLIADHSTRADRQSGAPESAGRAHAPERTAERQTPERARDARRGLAPEGRTGCINPAYPLHTDAFIVGLCKGHKAHRHNLCNMLSIYARKMTFTHRYGRRQPETPRAPRQGRPPPPPRPEAPPTPLPARTRPARDMSHKFFIFPKTAQNFSGKNQRTARA